MLKQIFDWFKSKKKSDEEENPLLKVNKQLRRISLLSDKQVDMLTQLDGRIANLSQNLLMNTQSKPDEKLFSKNQTLMILDGLFAIINATDPSLFAYQKASQVYHQLLNNLDWIEIEQLNQPYNSFQSIIVDTVISSELTLKDSVQSIIQQGYLKKLGEVVRQAKVIVYTVEN